MTDQALAATVSGARSDQADAADQVAVRPAVCVGSAIVVGAVAIVGLAHVDHLQLNDWIRTLLVVAWAATGAIVGVRRPTSLISAIALIGAGLGAAALLAGSFEARLPQRVALGLLIAVGLHLLISLPDGRLRKRSDRSIALVAAGIGLLAGIAAPDRSSQPDWRVFATLGVLALVVGVRVSHRNYLAANTLDKRRMQWVGWSMIVTAEVALALVALRLIADWPDQANAVALTTTTLIPGSIIAGSSAKVVGRVDRLLTHTVALAGLTALVIGAYLAVAVSLGRSLHDGERSLLLLSMAAAVAAALIYPSLRARLARTANQLVYGERSAPDEALRTWGSRLTRSIPLDELLLQLAESLRKSMSLQAAEIYTGNDGHYEVAAGVPHRERVPLIVGDKERAVVARAGVSGGTWLDVWLPSLAGINSPCTRVAPIAHGGHLLGLIVLTRRPDGNEFSDEDDRLTTELARQVGLALHNVQLDSALQASLDELQRTNVALQESRLRIVSAGDAERRRLERNLHDGAQQHLVALAVKLRMVEELVEDEPSEAMKVIDELRTDLKNTIAELRALAHGIFPPLLSSGGLAEALPAAATRAALDTTVDTMGVGRYSPEIESTVYFCCLEALQNASKHAGEDAEIAVTVTVTDGSLVFVVTDDGAGFVLGDSLLKGHGFVNMQDRLGTVGGSLSVVSAPGAGTSIRGSIPLP